MNLNMVHNIINIVIAALSALLVTSGCVENAAGALDCTASWIPRELTVIAIGLLSVLKVAMNIFRDGFGGLWKVQPPVQK